MSKSSTYKSKILTKLTKTKKIGEMISHWKHELINKTKVKFSFLLNLTKYCFILI